MISADEVVERWRRRRTAQGVYFETIREVQRHYNGDVIYPLPELDKSEKAFVPNLITQGLDQMAMRIGSTTPNVWFPSARPGIKVQDEKARKKRLATLGWWEMNHQNLKMRRRARWYLGYASSPVLIRPDFVRHIPMYVPKNPLQTFPATPGEIGDMTPADCIFAARRSLAWLKEKYPQQTAMLRKGDQNNPDGVFTVLEYVDCDETVMVVVGGSPVERSGYYIEEPVADGDMGCVMLERVPNRAGVCPVVCAGRITLDRPMGAFDTILGIHDMQAMLMALEVIAVKRSIFPDEWLVARPGEQPVVVEEANGLQGVIGRAKGGVLQVQQLNPGFQTQPMIDRLEAAQRQGASIPAEFGGESTSNIRTGRRGDAVLSAAVDMPVQEAQEVFQASLALENERAIAVAKAYFGSRQVSFYVSSKGARQFTDYKAADLFDDSDFNIVRYSAAGSDMNQLVTTGGQRVGIGTMSKLTFMEIDPLIEDPESEHEQVVYEALEQATLAALQQQAEQGQLPPTDLARIMELVRADGMTLVDAVVKSHKEAQERQASQAAPPAPGQAVSPGQMPGIAQPGAGAEQQPAPAVGPPPPSSSNLQALLATLHQPAGAAAGA
jgi:hypothetical protein